MCFMPRNSQVDTNMDIDDELEDNDDFDTGMDTQRASRVPTLGIEPDDNDVLAGRGNGVAARPGNQLFRDICIRYQQAYHDAFRTKKMDVARKVIHEITSKDPPGRFLEKNNSGDWVLMPPKRVLDKTSQALRDRPSIDSPRSSKSSCSTNSEVIQSRVTNDAPCFHQGALREKEKMQQKEQAPVLPSSYAAGCVVPLIAPTGIFREIDTTTLPCLLPPHATNEYMSTSGAVGSAYVSKMQQIYSYSSSMGEAEDSSQLLSFAQGVLQNQAMMEHQEQFEDAMEPQLNTSLEIYQVCVRNGYFRP